MTRPNRYALAFVLAAALAVIAAAWIARPVCTCVLGHNYPQTFAEYAASGFDDPADCAVHGVEYPE